MAWDNVKFPGDTVLSADWNSMTTDQKSRTKIDLVGALPGVGSIGRIVYLTTDNHLYLDTG